MNILTLNTDNFVIEFNRTDEGVVCKCSCGDIVDEVKLLPSDWFNYRCIADQLSSKHIDYLLSKETINR